MKLSKWITFYFLYSKRKGNRGSEVILGNRKKGKNNGGGKDKCDKNIG